MKKLLCVFLLGTSSVFSIEPVTPAAVPSTNITEIDLKEFAQSPPEVQKLIRGALQLAIMKLKYLYGSADPANGGVDCSGTIFYLLKENGLKAIPRDSTGFYKWIWQNGKFHSVISSNPASFEFQHLKPGDLLFWIGTYDVKRDPPISHVMLYLGTHVITKERLMMGASSSQIYKGAAAKEAVAVTTWNLSKVGQSGARFIGYGSVPGLVSPVREVKIEESQNPPPITQPTPPAANEEIRAPLDPR